MWTVLSVSFPPTGASGAKSGDRDGRNRSRITGAGSNGGSSGGGKIKQLDDKAAKNSGMSAPYADRG